MISKKETIRLAAEASGLSKTVVEKAIDAIDDIRYDIILTGNSCRMGRIGTLENSYIKDQAEKIGRNPKTNQPAVVPAQAEHNRPRCSFSKKLKLELKEATKGKAFKKAAI